jgi:holin-like protein
MKYLLQFWIILLFSFLGELLHYLIPLQIPASIYGLLLLFAALCTGIVKLPQIKETAKFLIEIMPLLFVPAGVGLLGSWGVLQPILVPVLVIMAVSTVLVMGISGRVTQFVIRRGKSQKPSNP